MEHKDDEAERNKMMQAAGKKFNAYVPGRDGVKPGQDVNKKEKPLFNETYDPRVGLDDAARKRIKDMIAASRQKNED